MLNFYGLGLARSNLGSLFATLEVNVLAFIR
jgi:hypothetical protein